MTTPDWDAGTPHPGTPYAGPPSYGPADRQSWSPPSVPYGTGAQPYGTAPYGGQPYGTAPYGGQPYGTAPYGAPPYGAPGAGQPGWGWTPYPQRPTGPQRPGSVIAAAVLVFASALLVLVGTLYGMAFSALVDLAYGPDSGLSPWLALVQLAQVGLLVVGGTQVLARDRRWLLVGCAVQLALSVYWAVVLTGLASAAFSDSVLVLPVVYGVLALVAAGLTFLPDARAWTARPAPTGEAAPASPDAGS